jgi:hypothetical protein
MDNILRWTKFEQQESNNLINLRIKSIVGQQCHLHSSRGEVRKQNRRNSTSRGIWWVD